MKPIVTLIGLVSVVSTALAETVESQLPVLDSVALKLLALADSQVVWCEGAELGLIVVSPVHLSLDPLGDCNHYDLPMATMVSNGLMVMYRCKGAGDSNE